MDQKKNQLNIIFGPLLIFLFAYFINYTLNITLANLLTISSYGLVNYTITLVKITSAILLIGTNSSSKRFLNTYLYDNHTSKISSYISWNLNLIYIPMKISIILAACTLLIIDPLEMSFIGKITPWTQVITFLLLASPALAAAYILASFLLCDDHIKIYTFIRRMGFYTILLMFLCFFNAFILPALDQQKIALTNVLRIMFASYLILLGIAYYYIKKISPKIHKNIVTFKFNATPKNGDTHTKRWNESAKRQLPLNLTYQFIRRMDLILLVLFTSNTTDIAIYGVALQTSIFLEKIPLGLFQHIKNKVSILFRTSKGKQQLQKHWNQSLKYNFILLTSTAIILNVYFKPILIFMYGAQYESAFDLIQILNLSFYVYSLGGDQMILLQYTGYANFATFGNISRVVLYTLSAWILHPIYGLIGIACASLIACTLTQLYYLILIKYFLKIKPYGII